MSTTRTKRFGSIQPFIRASSKDDNRYVGAQLGVVTYDKEDNYLVSYIEIGMRCDHLAQPILNTVDKTRRAGLSDEVKAVLPDSKLTVDSPIDCDQDLMRERVLHPSETKAPMMSNLQ